MRCARAGGARSCARARRDSAANRDRPTPASCRRILLAPAATRADAAAAAAPASPCRSTSAASNARNTATSQSCGVRNFRARVAPRFGQIDQRARTPRARSPSRVPKHAGDAIDRGRRRLVADEMRRPASSRRIARSTDGARARESRALLLRRRLRRIARRARFSLPARAAAPGTRIRCVRQSVGQPAVDLAASAVRAPSAAAGARPIARRPSSPSESSRAPARPAACSRRRRRACAARAARARSFRSARGCWPSPAAAAARRRATLGPIDWKLSR